MKISLLLQVRRMVASGIRVFMPDVPGVGIIRQRYPIMPDHVEGSGIDKNLAALQVCQLTLNAPIATKVVCFSRLLKCLRSLYGK